MHPTPGYTHVAVATGGKWVFVAGQTALAPDFSLIGGDDLRAQTVAAMENLRTALTAAGAGWDDVVRRTIYAMDATAYAVITEAIEEVTGSDVHPPQTILGVTGLALPELLVEIEV